MAKETWKNGDPLNDRLTIGRGGMKEFAAEPDRQIIGIVADSRDDGLNQNPGPKMFVPQAQIPDNVNVLNNKIGPMSWVIRTRVPPLSIAAAVESRLREATGLPVAEVRSMDQIVSRSTSREQFNTLLMAVFALSALTLAAIGIYGVMAYAVQQRTREIGVRLALGAEPNQVRTMVVLQGMRLALVGVDHRRGDGVRIVAIHEESLVRCGGARPARVRGSAVVVGGCCPGSRVDTRRAREQSRSARRLAISSLR